MAVVRGVESGFSLARAARGGMLSASDSRGREIAAIESTNGADTIATANLPIGAGWTLYSRLDDLFGRLCVMFTILLMLRLAVSISYSIRTRQLGAAKRIKRPTGVVSVQVKHPEGEIERPDEPQERIYRPPVRPPE